MSAIDRRSIKVASASSVCGLLQGELASFKVHELAEGCAPVHRDGLRTAEQVR